MKIKFTYNLKANTLLFLMMLFFLNCKEYKKRQNSFSSSQDTLKIAMQKAKGEGLFGGGAGTANFKEISESFANEVIYPEGIDSLYRLEFMVDFQPKSDTTYVEIIRGLKNGVPIFSIDQNYNKDFRDDEIRELKKMNWKSLEALVKCEYDIFNGTTMVRDSSWLRIGYINGMLFLGKSEHHLGEFSIDKQAFTIATIEPRNTGSFSYVFDPRIAIFSSLETKKDSIEKRDILRLQEILDLNGKFYRFEGISNDGSFVTLVKDKPLSQKIGTQVGMKAPSFSVVSIRGEKLTSKDFQDKISVIANSCGCGGDIESTQAVFDIKDKFGDAIHVLQVDSSIREKHNIYQIDSEKKENQSFYEIYRKQYCSRMVYVIGKDGRLMDKFEIFDWKKELPSLINGFNR